MAKKTFCNKCGREMDIFDTTLRFGLYKRLGYGSIHDGDYIELDICCDCLDAIIDSCVIDPIIPSGIHKQDEDSEEPDNVKVWEKD